MGASCGRPIDEEGKSEESLCCNLFRCCELDPPSENDVVRFFMIGTGGAGKTTVVRQLKCLCKNNPKNYRVYDGNWEEVPREDIFTTQEMMQFKRRIKSNIVTAIHNLIEQTHLWNGTISAAGSASRIKEMREIAEEQSAGGPIDYDYAADLVEDVVRLLQDEAIKQTLQRSHQISTEYRIEDGTLHFLNEERVRHAFDPFSEPTSEDIVHSRYPTTDITDFCFGIKDMRIRIHDTGGQSEEMRKLPEYIAQWIRGTEDEFKNFVLYVTSMADFNLPLPTDDEHTAMDKSLKTLSIILNMNPVHDCGLMIFFNKTDRFDDMCAEMMKTEQGRKDLLKYLGDDMDANYKKQLQKGKYDADQLRRAVTNRFVKMVKQQRRGKSVKGVYMRYTQAVDPKVMSTIFDAIQHELITQVVIRADYIIG